MKTENLISAVGQPINETVVNGRYGNALLTAGGYVLADPCYVLDAKEYDAFNAAARAAFPWDTRDYKFHRENWVTMNFHGRQAYWRDQSDGVGILNLTVDAGWVAAIPLELCSPHVRAAFDAAKATAIN